MGVNNAGFADFDVHEEWIDWLEQSLAQTRDELDETLERVQELERKLEEITDSPFWRLDRQISLAGSRLAPHGSRRRQLIRLGLRGVRALPKLRHRRWLEHQARKAVVRANASLWRMGRSFQSLGSRFLGRFRTPSSTVEGSVRFPQHDHVTISIIIPVFNHCRDTVRCLESIAARLRGPSFEVIVVDDASTDETPHLLGQVEGLVVLRNDENQGFIRSCNRGADAARGDYLVFLNNDTVVTDGWLQALLTTFENFPSTGLVGAKLIYPDGRLQEAGSLLWRDASGWNFGKFDDPDDPRYSFAREVDYCSGACVMVPRALFHQFGGFDDHFAPAYYEDADLAFRLREAGYRVMYQPLARIIHHEGLTSGRSTTTGVKAHQLVNQKKFRERWRHRLDSHPGPSQAPARIVAPHGVSQGRRFQILIIDHRMITPDRDAGSVRMLEMIRALQDRGHQVTFIPDNLMAIRPHQEQLQSLGVEVLHHPYCQSITAHLRAHGSDYDMVILSRVEIAARHMASVRRFAPLARVLFDTVDLHFLRQQREAELKQDPRLFAAVARMKQEELRMVKNADLTLVVSQAEQEILESECPWHEVRIFPTIYRVAEPVTFRENVRRNIVFIGSFEHPPNVDAVLYFAREILPEIVDAIPDAVFQVIGPDPTPAIRSLACKYVEVLGMVRDVAPYFDQARLSVAPLRFGAGVKGKVNQSMALGVPTVVTSIAAEGMFLVHERDTLIADDPGAFAHAIVTLWNSPQLWQRLSDNGRKNVQEYFSTATAKRLMDELLTWAEDSAAGTERNGVPESLSTRNRGRRQSPRSGLSGRRPLRRAHGAT